MAGRPWLSFGSAADPSAWTVLRLQIGAHAEELVPLRRALRAWLEEVGANEEEVVAMQIAAAEAAANAVEHAYREADPGPVWLAADLEPDNVVRVEIGDGGCWRPQRDLQQPTRGRGMLLMRECVDEVNLARTPDGTTVVLRLRLGRDG